MSLTGKGSLSISKKDLQNEKIPSYVFKKIIFAHKATLGDTGFNTSSLVTPSTELPGFVQASASDLTAASLLANRNNFALYSSLRGQLIDRMSYNPSTGSQVNFTSSFGTAEDGEIFIGIVDNVPKTGIQIVDGSAVPATGTLSAGQSSFSVGTPFELNKYPTQQAGAYLVYLDGILQMRNTGNVAASVTADGNYTEVSAGSNLSTSIQFNVIDPNRDRAVVCVPNGLLVSRPNDSMLAEVESLAGQLDQIIPDLAYATGNSTTKYQSAPNNVNLKGFGDRVFGLEQPGSPGSPRLATTSLAGAVILPPKSYVILDTGNGAGSSNTSVRRFTNQTPASLTADLTYTDSASLGGSITVNTTGLYHIAYYDKAGASGQDFGVTVNSTAAPNALGPVNCLGIFDVETSGGWGNVSTVAYLNAGDVIRATYSGGSLATNSDTALRVTRLWIGA